MKCVCFSNYIVRLISQQPPVDTHFFISISNSSLGKLFKWHTNCYNGLFPAPLLLPHSSFTTPLLSFHTILMTYSRLSSFFPCSVFHSMNLWQFNEKRFSIIQTKEENASIKTHLQTTQISRWMRFFMFPSNIQTCIAKTDV